MSALMTLPHDHKLKTISLSAMGDSSSRLLSCSQLTLQMADWAPKDSRLMIIIVNNLTVLVLMVLYILTEVVDFPPE